MLYTDNILPVIRSELKTKLVTLRLFSPYLTGDIALEIAELAKSTKIYTLLNVQVLVSGASSYETIWNLIDAGVPVYRVPKLHAKMIVADGQFTTVGSQNFTVSGACRNKEVNVRLRGVSDKVLRLAAKIESDCEEITFDFLDYVKRRADEFLEQFSTLQRQIAKVDKEVDKYSKKLSAMKRADSPVNRDLVRNLLKRPHSNPRRCTVVSRYDVNNFKWKHSLRGDGLLSWPMPGGIYRLEPQFRYLCVSNSGKIGWVRVNKTVYSFVENEVEYPKGRLHSRSDWQISIDASNSEPRKGFADSNLLVKISMDGRALCRVFMKYDVDQLKAYAPIGPYSKTPNKASSKAIREAVDWVKGNLTDFEKEVKKIVTTPFKFKENLTGVRADKFFGRGGTSLNLQLVDIGDGYALSVMA